jgi:hypothetical protein
MVAGVHYEGRAETVRAHCCDGDAVWLVRELRNRFSRNATLIRLENGLTIGYVPESEAVRLAPILDQGSRQAASIKKILTGGRAPIPVIWGRLYAPDAPVGEPAQSVEAAPEKAPQAKEPRNGCIGGIMAFALLITLGAAVLEWAS